MIQKKALVTGSSSGIGKAIALDLASKGFDVAFHYHRSVESCVQVCKDAAEFGVKTVALQADLRYPEQAALLVKSAAKELSGLSVIVNNVGNYLDRPTSQLTVDEWHEIINTNLHATFYVTQAALSYLKAAEGGRVVNLGCASAQNLLARDTSTPYFIAKTGIIIYSKSLAKELITEKITVNVVSPGVAENSFDLQEVLPELPTQRPVTMQEFADAAWFFIRPESEYITGQVLDVSGGWRL